MHCVPDCMHSGKSSIYTGKTTWLTQHRISSTHCNVILPNSTLKGVTAYRYVRYQISWNSMNPCENHRQRVPLGQKCQYNWQQMWLGYLTLWCSFKQMFLFSPPSSLNLTCLLVHLNLFFLQSSAASVRPTSWFSPPGCALLTAACRWLVCVVWHETWYLPLGSYVSTVSNSEGSPSSFCCRAHTFSRWALQPYACWSSRPFSTFSWLYSPFYCHWQASKMAWGYSHGVHFCSCLCRHSCFTGFPGLGDPHHLTSDWGAQITSALWEWLSSSLGLGLLLHHTSHNIQQNKFNLRVPSNSSLPEICSETAITNPFGLWEFLKTQFG